MRRILSGFCSSSLGKALAVRIGPSRNPPVIQRWLRQVSQMVYALRDFGLPPFGGVTDITGALERAVPGGEAAPEDFAAIAATLEGAAAVKGYLERLPETLDELPPLAQGLHNFEAEVAAIRRVVGDDGEVRDDASPRLGAVRREIEATTRQIHDVIYG